MANCNELTVLLLKNVDENIEIILESYEEISNWGKDLSELPLFTIQEIATKKF